MPSNRNLWRHSATYKGSHEHTANTQSTAGHSAGFSVAPLIKIILRQHLDRRSKYKKTFSETGQRNPLKTQGKALLCCLCFSYSYGKINTRELTHSISTNDTTNTMNMNDRQPRSAYDITAEILKGLRIKPQEHGRQDPLPAELINRRRADNDGRSKRSTQGL